MANKNFIMKAHNGTGYDVLYPKTTTEQIITDANNRFVSDTEKSTWNGKLSPGDMLFIYKCTGTNDDLAVQNIINDFLNKGAAMSMSLKIVGKTTKLRTNPESNSYAYLNINGANERGASVFLDCTDWEITDVGRYDSVFIKIDTDVELNCAGLIVSCNGSCMCVGRELSGEFRDCRFLTVDGYECMKILSTGKITGSFNNCSFISSWCAVSGSVGSLVSGTFLNCYIYGTYAAEFDGTLSGSFINCTLEGASGGGSGLSITLRGEASGSFINCKMSSTYGFVVERGSFLGSIFNCTINSGEDFGVCFWNGKFTGKVIDSKFRCFEMQASGTASVISLRGCKLNYLRQASPASTIRWNITDCDFAQSNININGQSSITYAVNDYVYMPQYANRFNQALAL